MDTQTGSQWATIAQAADHFQMSTDTVRRMISRGEIEAHRFGPRLVRVRLDLIEAEARPIVAAR